MKRFHSVPFHCLAVFFKPFIIGLVLTLTMFTVAAEAAKFEIPSNRRTSEVLPAAMISGPHYRVGEWVVSYGYMNQYSLDSDFGTFQVTGDSALRKLITEIKAIAVLREMKRGEAYKNALVEAGKQPLEFGQNLITNPVDTISGVPKGVARLFENVSAGLARGRQGGDDGLAQKALGASKVKREYASALGVDVYSNNSVLQKELNSLAWAGALGSLTLTAALAPVGGAAVAVSATRSASQLNDLLKDEPPERLYVINTEKLSSMGVNKSLIERFLSHPSYTPRQQTILVGSLASLKQVRAFDSFIELALTAHDDESATFYVNMAQILSGYNETVSPIQRLSGASPFVFAKAANGTDLMPLPLDYAIWTERASRVMPAQIAAYKSGNPDAAKKFELWVTGRVSPLAKQELKKIGAGVVEDVDSRLQMLD